MSKAYEYVKKAYGVSPKPGMRVTSPNGRHGTVARRKSYDHYVYVKLDDSKHAVPYHPLDLIYPSAIAEEGR